MDIQSLLCEEIQNELKTLKDLETGSDKYKTVVDGIAKLTDRVVDLEKITVESMDKEAARASEENWRLRQINEQTLSREEDYEFRRKQLEEQIKARESEESWKRIQMETDKNNRVFDLVVKAAEIGVPAIITIWGVLKSFEFEREGTITTPLGRGFINKLLPRK